MKLLRLTVITLYFLISVFSVTAAESGSDSYVVVLSIETNRFMHLDVSEELQKSTSLDDGRSMGTIQPMPAVQSPGYQQELERSMALYDRKEYEQAADVLREAVENEPGNPFILNAYARALYWHDSKESFPVYKRLVALLDSQYDEEGRFLDIIVNKSSLDSIVLRREGDEILDMWNKIRDRYNPDPIVIDCWFGEAYWKLGTLHLDRNEYLEAAYEITRSMMISSSRLPHVMEQAMGFLTEAYYFLGYFDLARHCIAKAREINPSNKYVTWFEKQMDETAVVKEFSNHEGALELLKQIRMIVDEIDKNGGGNDTCRELLTEIEDHVAGGRLSILVSEVERESLLTTAEFVYANAEVETPKIIIHRSLVDNFSRHPALAMAILVHEMQHAHDYFENREFFLLSAGSMLEQYLFQMDALHVEAMFIRDYIVPGGYQLGAFESALLKSNTNDNLSMYSYFVMGTDMNLVYKLYMLRKSRESYPDLVLKVLESGRKIVDELSIPEDGDDMDGYIAIVPLVTWQKYASEIITSISNSHNWKLTFKEKRTVRKYYREVNNLIGEMQKTMKPYMDLYQATRQSIVDNMDPMKK
jgi:tetratricopeptide (TPR) repeat protein